MEFIGYHISQKLHVPILEFEVVRIGESFERNYFGQRKDEEIEVRAGPATACLGLTLKICANSFTQDLDQMHQDPSPFNYSSAIFHYKDGR